MSEASWIKTMFLIRRRAGVSREELIAHWFANHMPEVIRSQQLQASAGRVAARRYIATLFDPDPSGGSAWDGVAQLWFDAPLPRPKQPFGEPPRDSFQERAEPYVPWPTEEQVIVDGQLPVEALTLNAPFPTTRSGFVKATYLIVTKRDADHDAFFRHWLDVHAPSVVTTLNQVGGFRYVISTSAEPAIDPYAGMAELYFPDTASWERFRETLPDDGMGEYIERLEVRTAGTEMIGIP
jgi:hypothetical protein